MFLNLQFLFAKYSGFLFPSTEKEPEEEGEMGNGCVKSFKFSKCMISVLNVLLWLPRERLISDGEEIQALPSRCDVWPGFQ